MPLYEYKCVKCRRLSEKIEPVNGPHLKKCPHCGAKVEPQISTSAIQFKGSGWYVTDYAGKKSSGSNSDAGKDEKSTSEKKDSDSKDAAKESKDAGTKETSAKDAKETKDTKEKKSEKPAKK